MPETALAPANLNDCASEPIRIPGAIQPHGYLFVLEGADHRVVAVSQNAADAFALPVADMIGRPVADFLACRNAENLADEIGLRSPDSPIPVRFRGAGLADDLDCSARADDGLIVLELEAAASAKRAANLFGQVRSANERIRRSESIDQVCQTLAVEIRRLTGYDRVMVYRFDPEWNGQIVAEDRRDGAPSYLGLAFPASDIPAQARALYLLNTVRIIPDAGYRPSPIIPPRHPGNGRPFDLSQVSLRSVSPVHLEYLANMGVAATMAVSIVRDNQLWGLVVCHNSSAHVLPRCVLQACDLLAQAMAWFLDTDERTAAARRLDGARRLESALVSPDAASTYRERLKAVGPALLDLSGASAMALCDDLGPWAIGAAPADAEIVALAQWLSTLGCERFATDRLSQVYPPSETYAAVASGLCAVQLRSGWLMFFRPEWRHTMRWAGEPVKLRAEAGGERLSPRKSFAAWQQRVLGRSSPWSPADILAAAEIRVLLLRAMMTDQLRLLTENEGALTLAKLKAEDASHAKSEFLAHMSHEIRTPLNGVLGMAQLMAKEPLPVAQRERLGIIQKSGDGLLSILNDILDLSKIEAGQFELEEAAFDIDEVAGDVHAVFAPIASTKDVNFVLDLRDDARGVWRGDAVRLRQLISNLVSNALKFTSVGEVRLCVDATIRDGVKWMAICVADTGIGVAPEALPKLFEPFVQADSTTTRRFGGTGLGLTITLQIAQLMGGDIDVRSEVGKGTVFDVRLPLVWVGRDRQALAPAPAKDVGPFTDLSALRVLAAEDNETNQLVLKAVLGSLGVHADIVDNGQSAIDAWAAGQFDLILMDVQMPVLDGVTATRQIRRREVERNLPRTPIIAFSASTMEDQVAGYLATGFDGHLAKPINITSLYMALEAVAAARASALSAPSQALA